MPTLPEAVRAIARDFSDDEDQVLTDANINAIADLFIYQDDDGSYKINLMQVSVEYLLACAQHHADMAPMRSKYYREAYALLNQRWENGDFDPRIYVQPVPGPSSIDIGNLGGGGGGLSLDQIKSMLNADHLLLPDPDTGVDGQVPKLQADGSVSWENDLHSAAGAGVDQAGVDSSIRTSVSAWARTPSAGGTGTVPLNKIPSDIARDSEVLAAENRVGALVRGEASQRQTADEALGRRIDALPTDADLTGFASVANLNAEASTRKSADDALGTRIDGKQDSLPALGDNQVWVGPNAVATNLPTGGGGSVTFGTDIKNITDVASAGDSNKAAHDNHVHNLLLQSSDLAFDGTKKLGLSTGTKARLLPTGATQDQYASYNGSEWVAATLPEAGGDGGGGGGEATLQNTLSITLPSSQQQPSFNRSFTYDFTKDELVEFYIVVDFPERHNFPGSNNNIVWGLGDTSLHSARRPYFTGADLDIAGEVPQYIARFSARGNRELTANERRHFLHYTVWPHVTGTKTLWFGGEWAGTSSQTYGSLVATVRVYTVTPGGGGGGGGTTLSDDAVLDLIKENRTAADRGKLLGVSHSDQNALAFLDAEPKGSIAVTPNRIDTHTDVDGTYTLAAEDLDDAALKAAGVDQYEIWFKSEGVHTVSSWTPVADFSVEFTVDTTEETNIGVTSSDKLIPVRLVFRSGGTFVSLLNTWMEIRKETPPDRDITPETISGAPAFVTFLADQERNEDASIVHFTVALQEAYKGVTHTYKANDYAWFPPMSVDGKVFANIPPPTDASLSLAQQIGLARHQVQPNVIIGRAQGNIARAYKIISDNAALITDAAWVQVVVQGQNVGTRDRFDGNHAFTIPNDVGTAIENNLGSDEFFEVNVQFWDAATDGTLITTLHLTVEAQALPYMPQTPLVLQAAVDGGDTAGATSVTLPANFATYRRIFVDVWEDDTDFILEGSFHTSMLAAQTANRTIVLGGLIHNNQQGRTVRLTWNPTTRALAAIGSERIIGAELEP